MTKSKIDPEYILKEGCRCLSFHENTKLRKELEETKNNLVSTQVWLICCFVTCILIMTYSIIGK